MSSNDYVGLGMFVLIFVAVPVFLAVTVIKYMNTPAEACFRHAKVTQVGGCDALGFCGVMTSAKEKSTSWHPVSGQEVCLEWKESKDSN